MATKREIVIQLFWLRLACIDAKLVKFAALVDELYRAFLPTDDSHTANEIAIRALNAIRLRMIERGFDWENAVAKFMAKNFYQSFDQMYPDFGF